VPRQTKDWITSYLTYTENSEPPKLFHEWVAISCIAAVLQRKCYLRWGPMIFYPNMYVVLVAPSGKARKGTAMTVGAELLQEIGIKMASEAITREALIRELAESERFYNEPDGTPVSHASLTIYSQELTVFLGYNNLQLISDITDWYDCRQHWTYRTKHMGTDEIIGVWVNLIGATTPELIRNALPADAIGGGLASRIIFVFEEDKGKIVPAPFLSPQLVGLRKDLLYDLEDIYTQTGMCMVTKEFVGEWSKWYIDAEGNPPFDDHNFSGYISRRPNHIMKLSMILAASEDCRSKPDANGETSLLITDQILFRAIDLLERTEIKMRSTFMGYGRAEESEVLSRMMSFIAKKQQVQKSHLLRQFYADIGTITKLDDMINILKGMEFIYEQATGTGKIIYVYNPNNPHHKQFVP